MMMKNTCSNVSKLLEKYFDHEVKEKERFLIEAHIQDCSACRDVLKSMEELKDLIKIPIERVVEQEDFPWVWQKIEREIRSQEKLSWWQSLKSWLDVSPLFKKRVWIPALATILVLLLVTAQIFLKKITSYSGASVVEYVESQTNNVMVYDIEKAKVTVIWIFEGAEEEVHSS